MTMRENAPPLSAPETDKARIMMSVWAVMVVATLLIWGISEFAHASPEAHALRWPVFIAATAMSALKVCLIAWYYMDMKDAPRWLQTLIGVWICAVFAIISLLHMPPQWLKSLQLRGL